MIYWFIGQPGCGKTTLARKLKKQFEKLKKPVLHLDGDDLREIFGGTYRPEHFTKEYRDTNTRMLQKLVEHIADQGITVIVSTVNSERAIREELKDRNARVTEVYVVNDGRHVREEYKRIDFEEPQTFFIRVDTADKTPEESFEDLMQLLYPGSGVKQL